MANACLEVRVSLTAEQLEAARAERLRQNGHGALVIEDARTWVEETGLCHFLPRKQSTPSVAPSFVEAVAGREDATPDPRFIAISEELLVRLEADDVALRLNLHGLPGERPDYVVAAWVLPYVYALRGDRDWRRTPQLTGSRQVSPLAIQAYKLLEAGDATVSQLRTALGREVTEAAVVRAITELWQQLRIVPVVAAPGAPAKWQLLRHRFQKAIAEGASTSQVTAISVLASIYLQAVIAASMEEVELFLAPLTSRSKVREVLRGLVATRQVNTTTVGHSSYFYVAGTLPEFPATPTIYASSSMTTYSYGYRGREEELEIAASASEVKPAVSLRPIVSQPSYATTNHAKVNHAPSSPAKVERPVVEHHARTAHRPAARTVAKTSERHPKFSRPAGGARPASSTARPARVSSNGNGSHSGNGSHGKSSHSNGASRNGAFKSGSKGLKSSASARPAANAAPRKATAKPVHKVIDKKTWAAKPASARTSSAKPANNRTRSASSNARPVGRGTTAARPGSVRTGSATSRSNSARPTTARTASSRPSTTRTTSAKTASVRSAATTATAARRKPATATAKRNAGSATQSASKRFAYSAARKQETKKRK